MSRLWVFGDSFTAGNGSNPSEEYSIRYKLTDDDIIWPEILAKELSLSLVNRGRGLYSNDKILDTIMEDYFAIADGDIVVIGKTFSSRFDIPNKSRELLMTISPVNLDPTSLAYFNAGYNKRDMEYLWQMVEYMDDAMLTKRQDFRFNFLKSVLLEYRKVKNCIIWDVDGHWQNFETINDATKGDVFDHHWSYQGHRDFAKYITKQIKQTETAILGKRLI